VQPAFCKGNAAQPLSASSPGGRQVTPDVLAKAAASSTPEGFKWGADMKNLGISVALGLAVWFCPTPSGITPQAWHLLAIFVSTIVGIITQPLPLGAVAMLGLGAAMVTKTLTFAQAFSAFASEIPYDLLTLVNSFISIKFRTRGDSCCCRQHGVRQHDFSCDKTLSVHDMQRALTSCDLEDASIPLDMSDLSSAGVRTLEVPEGQSIELRWGS
jgi:Sodium:sulfate symporter transmembrane region